MKDLKTRYERIKKIKEYQNSDLYQPEIDSEIERQEGQDLTIKQEIQCSGDAEYREEFFDNDSHVEEFFVKYAECIDPRMVAFKNHLTQIISDFNYIKESDNTNEQWALDYADALNEISTSL